MRLAQGGAIGRPIAGRRAAEVVKCANAGFTGTSAAAWLAGRRRCRAPSCATALACAAVLGAGGTGLVLGRVALAVSAVTSRADSAILGAGLAVFAGLGVAYAIAAEATLAAIGWAGGAALAGRANFVTTARALSAVDRAIATSFAGIAGLIAAAIATAKATRRERKGCSSIGR